MTDISQVNDLMLELLEQHTNMETTEFTDRGREIVDEISDYDAEGHPYVKSKQVARCGNAVTPQVPAALVRANLPEECIKKAATAVAATDATKKEKRKELRCYYTT